MAEKNTEEREIKVLYELKHVPRDLKIYREGDNVVFSYIEHGNSEDECNDSFCAIIKTEVFKRAIIELFETGSCVLSEIPEFNLEKHRECLSISYSISDYHKIRLSIENFNFTKLVL